jgi:hypothetical protein
MIILPFNLSINNLLNQIRKKLKIKLTPVIKFNKKFLRKKD